MSIRTRHISAWNHAAVDYLARLAPAEAEGLLFALDALRDWMWEMHRTAIVDEYGDEGSDFCRTHAEDPDFMKEDI